MAGDGQFTRTLGWLSLGLGLTELAAPKQLSQLIGVKYEEDTRNWLYLAGLREVVCGVGILTRRNPKNWLWARVAGDVMDLSLLGSALNSKKSQQEKIAMAMVAVGGITALDLGSSQQKSQQSNGHVSTSGSAPGQQVKGIRVKKSVAINSSPEEAYNFWHDFSNLPRFMSHLEAVQVLGEGRSHWKAKAPAKASVEWDAEVTRDIPNELISWRSLENADIPNSGTVHFERAPGNRGTFVKVEMQYDPPAGKLGALVAKLFGEEPEQQVQDDLRAFKQMIETGEILYSDSTIHGHPHPAQPPATTKL
ncbi:MAG TPA: SRPBCC family protein [Chloroflexia bacterium]|nr:SRPBCC family protein [Chloroflexia bacterium]